MSKICGCPRCGERAFEKLKTYSHCSNCLYAEDTWESPNAAYLQAMKDITEIETAQDENKKVKQSNQKEKNEISICA
ncbi:MAG: hypothetical protein JNL11_03425 [Bdellovibrionaceae bacterium]|nr:hypothetical protein [Pseudobdellovibrionaceae bacterium]